MVLWVERRLLTGLFPLVSACSCLDERSGGARCAQGLPPGVGVHAELAPGHRTPRDASTKVPKAVNETCT